MTETFVDLVYYTLQGILIEEARVPGVENGFAPGSLCERRYSEMRAAYGRLCQRLGVEDEDGDVEIIINALMDIERELSFRMYHYGAVFGE